MIRFLIAILFFISVSSQALAQNAANPAQQLFDEQVNKVKWKDLSVEFRPVTEKSAKGSQAMVVKSADQENGKTYYVGKSTILGLKDIGNMDVTYNPNDLGMLRLIMRFNDDGKKTLSDYTTKNVGNMMGVVIDGQLRLVAHIRQPLVNGKVQVYGFSANEAADIAKRYYQPKLDLARQIQELQNKK